jgi:hypothetical protein
LPYKRCRTHKPRPERCISDQQTVLRTLQRSYASRIKRHSANLCLSSSAAAATAIGTQLRRREHYPTSPSDSATKSAIVCPEVSPLFEISLIRYPHPRAGYWIPIQTAPSPANKCGNIAHLVDRGPFVRILFQQGLLLARDQLQHELLLLLKPLQIVMHLLGGRVAQPKAACTLSLEICQDPYLLNTNYAAVLQSPAP